MTFSFRYTAFTHHLPFRYMGGLILLVIVLTSGLNAQSDGRVQLPTERLSSEMYAVWLQAQEQGNASPAWQAFLDEHPGWFAMWNEWTGMPMRLWGPPMPIPTFSQVDAVNAEAAARAALDLFRGLIPASVELRHLGTHPLKESWVVTFSQVYQGRPIVNATVTVRLSPKGTVFLVGADVVPSIETPDAPRIESDMVPTLALAGLTVDRDQQPESRVEPLSILPISAPSGLRCELVYPVEIRVNETSGWRVHVSAITGEVLWRTSLVYDGSDGIVMGSARTNSVLDAPVTLPFSSLYVRVNTTNATTNASGQYTSPYYGTSVATLKGPYVLVDRLDGGDASSMLTATNGGTLSFMLDNSNSTLAERTVFYNVVRGHDFVKALDPALTGLDYQMTAKVNASGTCNAMFDGNGLTFYRAGSSSSGTCLNPGEMPDVILHEYGHAINDKLFKQLGVTAGMTNASLHEALADGNASLMLDRPEIGLGFFGTGTQLRSVYNTKKIPDDVTNESHADGEILAGAIWDTRLLVGLPIAQSIVHYAKRGLPDDANLAKAYTKYFIDLLQADDNDNNLSNGTPHSVAIAQAFIPHGIPGAVLSVTHTPVTASTGSTPIPLVATAATALTDIAVQSVTVYYRVRPSTTWIPLPMNLAGGSLTSSSTWSISIPGLPDGSIVEYFVEVKENYGGWVRYPSNAPTGSVKILVGFQRNTLYDFESAQNWSGSQPSDDATSGTWINADPVGTQVSGVYVQPETDHTTTGVKCWVTGNGAVGADPGVADVDDGSTTLTSPVFSLAGFFQPVIRYWRWYSNQLGANPGTDYWVVQISNNDGFSWVTVENTNASTNAWTPIIFEVSQYVVPTANMRLRFIASDVDPQSLVEAAVDDVEILYAQSVPVELTSLSAHRVRDLVRVSWTTDSESHNRGFEVEVKCAGSDTWTSMGFVEGRGTTTENQSYEFSFRAPDSDAMRIRLKQTDLDGTFQFSPEIEVAARPRGFALEPNAPNPFSTSTILRYSLAEEGEVTVLVSNGLGQVVRSLSLPAQRAGQHLLTLNLSDLPAGAYQCLLRSKEYSATRTLLLRR